MHARCMIPLPSTRELETSACVSTMGGTELSSSARPLYANHGWRSCQALPRRSTHLPAGRPPSLLPPPWRPLPAELPAHHGTCRNGLEQVSVSHHTRGRCCPAAARLQLYPAGASAPAARRSTHRRWPSGGGLSLNLPATHASNPGRAVSDASRPAGRNITTQRLLHWPGASSPCSCWP